MSNTSPIVRTTINADEDGEYRVRLYIDNVHQENTDYYTENQQDAVETSRIMRRDVLSDDYKICEICCRMKITTTHDQGYEICRPCDRNQETITVNEDKYRVLTETGNIIKNNGSIWCKGFDRKSDKPKPMNMKRATLIVSKYGGTITLEGDRQ